MELIHKNRLIKELSLTYSYVKHLIDQSIYPEEKFCISVDPLEPDEIYRIIFNIKMRHETNDYSETLELLQMIFTRKEDDLTKDLKVFVKHCFQMYVEADETAWEVINDGEKNTNEEYKEELCKYKSKVTASLIKKYETVISMIQESLIPKAK